MNPEKVRQLIRNIRDLKYPPKALKDVEGFEEELAKDLATDRQEAMSLLGYLLARNYALMIPGVGLVLNPDNEEVQRIVKSGNL